MKTKLIGICLIFQIVAVAAKMANAQDIEYVGAAACSGINDVRVFGNYAFCAREDGLMIFNIADSTAPTITGQISLLGQGNSLYVTASYVYMANGSRGLQDINVTDLANPALVGSYDTPDVSLGLDVVGVYAYVADAASGMQIINIADRTNPTLTSTFFDPSGIPVSVRISGAYAYIVDGAFGLRIVNVLDPTTPILVGSLDLPGYANGIVKSDIFAYIAAQSAGLRIINISDPINPIETVNYPTIGWVYAVTIQGHYAYLADSDAGIEMVDITIPGAPVFVTAYDTPHFAKGVAVNGEYIYVADQDSLIVLRFNPTSDVENDKLPGAFALSQNYPNPFNAQTTLRYSISLECEVAFDIYNIAGQRVATLAQGRQDAGAHTAVWDASAVSSGIYFARLRAVGSTKTIKLTFQK